jgi:hypothetical protein
LRPRNRDGRFIIPLISPHLSLLYQRGMGEGAVGCSLSLISPGEDKGHAKIVEALAASFQSVELDGRLFNSAQERVNLACKVVETDDIERRSQRSNQWFKEKAEEAGLELDDDLLEEGLGSGDKRDRSKLRESQKARSRLQQLLSEPMQTQRYGKFLSTNSAASQHTMAPPVSDPLSSFSISKKKPRRNL